MPTLSDDSRVVTVDDLDAFDSQFPKGITQSAVPQLESRIITQEDLDELGETPYDWKAPSLSAPRTTLINERLAAESAANQSALKVARIESFQPVFKRISLEGQGEFLKALGADIINSGLDKDITLENLYAAWKGEKLPIDVELDKQILENPTDIRTRAVRAIGGVVGSVPALIEGGAVGKAIGGITKAPLLSQSAGFGAAMGSETYSKSQGDWEQALKSAAVGAAFPAVGKWAATVGGKVSKSLVEKGIIDAESNTVQKGIEFIIEQSALQGFGNVINTPEYAQIYKEGGWQALAPAILENSIGLAIYAFPGLVKTLSPRFHSEFAQTMAREGLKNLDKAISESIQVTTETKPTAKEQPKQPTDIDLTTGIGVEPSPVDAYIASQKPREVTISPAVQGSEQIIPEQTPGATVGEKFATITPEQSVSGLAQTGQILPSPVDEFIARNRKQPVAPIVEQNPTIVPESPTIVQELEVLPNELPKSQEGLNALRNLYAEQYPIKGPIQSDGPIGTDSKGRPIIRVKNLQTNQWGWEFDWGVPELDQELLSKMPSLVRNAELNAKNQKVNKESTASPTIVRNSIQPLSSVEPVPASPEPSSAQEQPFKPLGVLNYGVPLEHRGGELPDTVKSRAGIKLLTKAITNFGESAKRFTGIRFNKSEGFGLEVSAEDPTTLVVDPEKLHSSIGFLKKRYKGGVNAALDEEVFHSFQLEVLNNIERVDPGFGKRMYDEMTQKQRQDTWNLYGSKLGETETVLEFLRIKNQLERGVLTEGFTRRHARSPLQAATKTMRDFIGAIGEFIQKLFGDEKPKNIQSFYDAVLKSRAKEEREALADKIAKEATDVQDYNQLFKPKGTRVTEWSDRDTKIVSEAMKSSEIFAPWIAGIEEKLRPIVATVTGADSELQDIAISYMRYKKLPEWALHFMDKGKPDIGNIRLQLSNVRTLESFKNRLKEVKGEPIVSAEEEQKPSPIDTAAEQSATPSESALASDVDPKLQAILEPFIKRYAANKNVMSPDEMLALGKQLRDLGYDRQETMDAIYELNKQLRLLAAKVQKPEDVEAIKSAEKSRLTALDQVGAWWDNRHNKIYTSRPIEILQGKLQSAFYSLPQGARDVLQPMLQRFRASELAIDPNDKVLPRQPGESIKDYIARLYQFIDDPVIREQYKSFTMHETNEQFRQMALELRDLETVDLPRELKTLSGFEREIQSERYSKAVSRAALGDIRAKEIMENYQQQLLNARDAIAAKAKRTAADDQMAEDYARQIDWIENVLKKSNTISKAFFATAGLFSEAELRDQNLTPILIGKRIRESKLADVPMEDIPIIANMFSQWVDMKKDLLSYKVTGRMSDKEFSDAIKSKMADIGAVERSKSRQAMIAFANAREQQRAALDVVRKIDKRFDAQYEKVQNMIQAYDFLKRSIESPEHQRDWMELAKTYDETHELVTTDASTNERTYKNPNPIPDDPEAAAEYVSEIKVNPYYEWTAKEAAENSEKLFTVLGWLEEYQANHRGKDPTKDLMVEHHIMVLKSHDLNPYVNPKLGKALKPYRHWWQDWWQVPHWITRFRTPRHVHRMTPGRGSYEAYSALQRWAIFQSRSIQTVSDLGFEVQRLSKNAAESHRMTTEAWDKTVNNRIIDSWNQEGETPIKEGYRIAEGVTVNRADMEAFWAQRKLHKKTMENVMREEDPSYKIEPLKIVMEGTNRLRKAYEGPGILPRKWSEDAKSWAKQMYAAQGDTAKIIELLDGVHNGDTILKSHVERMATNPFYTIGKNSPILQAYRELNQRIILNPGKYRITGLNDLANKLVDCGAEKDGKLLSPNAVRDMLIREFSLIAKNIYDPQKAATIAEGKTAPSITVESADNFTTVPRGEVVAPAWAYDYSLATDLSQIAFAGQVQRPYFVRYVEALTAETRAINDKIASLKNDIKARYGLNISESAQSKILRKETEKAQKERDLWLSYDDLMEQKKRHEALLTQMQELFQQLEMGSQDNAYFSSLARMVSGSLMGQPTSVMRNTYGAQTSLSTMSMLTGAKQRPFTENMFMNSAMNAYYRIPFLSDAVRWGVDMALYTKDITEAALRSMERIIVDNPAMKPVIQPIIKNIKSNPKQWGRFLLSVADQIESNSAMFDKLVADGIVERANIWNKILNDIRFVRTSGKLESKPLSRYNQLAGVTRSTLDAFASTVGGGSIVQAAENVGNRAAIRWVDDRVAELEPRILHAYKNRKMEGVDINRSVLDPKEMYGKNDKEFLHFQQVIGPAIRLDYYAQKFAKAYYDAKEAGKPTDDIHLFNNEELSNMYFTVAESANKPTSASRPPATKTRWAKLMAMFYNYTLAQSEVFSEARARLIGDTSLIDPNFNTSRMMLMYALTGLALAYPIGYLNMLMFRKKRNIPDPWDATSISDFAKISLLHSQSLLPIMGSFMAGIPSQFGASKWQSSMGMSIVPLAGVNAFWDSLREVAQTHDVTKPAVKLVSQWYPLSQLILNRMASNEGTRELKNVNISLGIALKLADVETRPQASGPMGGVKTPVTPLIDSIVNYLNAPSGPNWQMINSLKEQAVQMLYDKGNVDAEKSVNRMVMSRAPLQSRAGRSLTTSENAAVLSKMDAVDLQALAKAEDNFAQYAAVTGSPAPTALTNPKPSRREMPTGGSSQFVGGGSGPTPMQTVGASMLPGRVGGASIIRSPSVFAVMRTTPSYRTGTRRGRRTSTARRFVTKLRAPVKTGRKVRVPVRRSPVLRRLSLR